MDTTDHFALTLNRHRKSDMIAALHFFVWFLSGDKELAKLNREVMQDAARLTERVMMAGDDDYFSMDFNEFMNVYSAVQYMAVLIKETPGIYYVEEIFGSEKEEAWKASHRDYFQTTCMYLINECNDKFSNVPSFVMERTALENQLAKLLGK